MIKNYLKIAWRNLWKSKFYTLINISGLAVGLATSIMLLLWVQKELSYDKFHKEYADIYQLSSHFPADDGGTIVWTGVPAPLAVYSKSFPEVESIVRINSIPDQVLTESVNDKVIDGNSLAFVDPGFLSVFNFPLVAGDKKNAFAEINSVLLTESTAQKLFGRNLNNYEEILDKTVAFHKENFVVKGILKDFPENSSIQYDALFPMAFHGQWFSANGGNGDWKTIDEDVGNFSFETYVKLQPRADPVITGEKFSSAYKNARNGDSDTAFKLQPLADVHLVAADGNDASFRMVRIFMLVVILLLAIAAINYVNLSTARSLMRAKEVAVRKIVGANKVQLFFQFITETVLLFCISGVLAIGLIYLLMPLYNNISGKQLIFGLSDTRILEVIGLAILVTLVASSIYPAFLLSSFKPIQAIKGKFTSSIGAASFRKVLVVFQFGISVILLICTVVMGRQIDFIKNKDLGYDKSHVFNVFFPDDALEHMDAVKTELKKSTSIVSVSTSDTHSISNVGASTGDIDWDGKAKSSNMVITQLSADNDFIPTMKMKFVEGGNFKGTPADSTSYILNETAVKQMGLKPPYVGQQVTFYERKGNIIGVLKDFNFSNLKQKITPILIFSKWWTGNFLYVRTTGDKVQKAIASVEKEYKKYAGDVPFAYYFLDKRFDDQYKSDQRSALLFNVFACIAIFISCLGLFGLSTYTAQTKKKEIGIRKVLGADVSHIVALISADFLKLVGIAILLAIPIAWYAMRHWLQDFAYKTSLEWWMFALAGIIAVMIAFATISFQAIKAAIANPAKSLRTE